MPSLVVYLWGKKNFRFRWFEFLFELMWCTSFTSHKNLDPENKTSITQLGQVLTVNSVNLSFLGSHLEVSLIFQWHQYRIDVLGTCVSSQFMGVLVLLFPWLRFVFIRVLFVKSPFPAKYLAVLMPLTPFWTVLQSNVPVLQPPLPLEMPPPPPPPPSPLPLPPASPSSTRGRWWDPGGGDGREWGAACSRNGGGHSTETRLCHSCH